MEKFKPGTYFTGINRTCYPRSLYQYMGYDAKKGTHKVLFYALRGIVEIPPLKLKWKDESFLSLDFKNKVTTEPEYREATEEEVLTYKKTGLFEPLTNYPKHQQVSI